MTIDPVQLLKHLAHGSAPGANTAGSAPIESSSFADLLESARNGELSKNAPITVDPDVTASLTDDQLAALSFAADKAEAAGIRTALVRVGGQQLVLDVASRRITASATAESGVIAGVDGVLDLDQQQHSTPPQGLFGPLVLRTETPTSGGSSRSPQSLALPGAGTLENPSLARLLAGLNKAG